MDNEEEDDQEIGLQDEESKQRQQVAADTKETEGGAQVEGEGEYNSQAPYPRKKKDYGAAYNPNYKKGPWRKGQVPEETKGGKQVPAIARQKNERGDYVVTTFQIPDRATSKVEKVSETAIAQLASPSSSNNTHQLTHVAIIES